MASKSGGQENMIRVVMAIVDEFSEILRDVLQKNISSTQLQQITNRSNIQLRPEQLNFINSANVSGYAGFDITLSYTLIRNLCSSIKPTQGWGHSKGPGQNDLSLGDDIERIRLIRNEVYGHVSSSFMTDSDFQKHWHEISSICKRMEQRLGRKYTNELAKIESCVIDKKLEEKYKGRLETEKQIIEEIQGMQITMSKVESQMQSLKEMLQENQSVDKDYQLNTRISQSPMVSPIMEKKVDLLFEIACDSLNAVVDAINENTSNNVMFQALEEILRVGSSLEGHQGDQSDKVIGLLSQLKAKVKWYATVDERHGQEVLLKFIQVTVTLMNRYKVKFQGIKGSMVLKLQFLNREGCQKYRDDVENGNVYRLFSTALLDPTFLSLLGLEMKDLDFSFEIFDDGKLSYTKEMTSVDPMAQDVIRCDLCVKAVELHCNPCRANLCEDCVSKHMLKEKSKKHEVVLFRDRKTDTTQQQCPSHTDQKCDFFCKDCKERICAKCVTGSHKKHKFVHLDEHIVESNKELMRKENEELEKNIIPTHERNFSEIGEQITSVHEKYNAIDTQISDNGEKWHKEIDIVIKKHKSEVNKMKTTDIATLQGQQTEMRDILQLARDTLQRNKRLLQSSDINEIKEYRSRIEELRTVPPRITMSLPSFTPIRIQGEHLYKQFGKLRAAIESEISGYRIKKLEKPALKDEIVSNKKPLFYLACVPGGKFWISGEDSTIDLLDTQGIVLETVSPLSGENPDGLTVTRDGDLVYCDGTKGNINMVKNGTTTTIITLHDWTPNGVCSTSIGGLIVCMINDEDNTRKRIVKYDANYRELMSVERDNEDKPLLTTGLAVTYVAENRNSDICIADTNAVPNCVIALDQNGIYRWRYKGHLSAQKYDEFCLIDITTDSQGHIIAADYANNCLHVIDQDGQFICYIDSCGLKNPYCLSVDDEDRLYTGENKDPECAIKVFSYLK